MEVSIITNPADHKTTNGFGYAAYNIILALKELGVNVPYDSVTSPIQLCFSSPRWYKKREGQFSIGYTPWESTLLPDGWVVKMNMMDEIWATNPLTAEIFRQNGVNRPIRVFEHGIDHIWSPVKRKVEDEMRFLHVGAPAYRKGWIETVDAFQKAFPDSIKRDTKVSLILKTSNKTLDYIGSYIDILYNNIYIKDRVLDVPELVKVYHESHAMVYPSYGEGFGLIPLQSIATGMPTAVTGWWASYKEFAYELGYDMIDSPWPEIHPGQMSKPKLDDIVDYYRYVYDNYDLLSQQSYDSAHQVHEKYDWVNVTRKAFEHFD